mmetsp:Transcript_2020/g.6591  ORF Transcript_2020/g.6591 Transcript_2020/m.6591 type:complete len:267 (+) Transcript_2020:2024-2824(+)
MQAGQPPTQASTGSISPVTGDILVAGFLSNSLSRNPVDMPLFENTTLSSVASISTQPGRQVPGKHPSRALPRVCAPSGQAGSIKRGWPSASRLGTPPTRLPPHGRHTSCSHGLAGRFTPLSHPSAVVSGQQSATPHARVGSVVPLREAVPSSLLMLCSPSFIEPTSPLKKGVPGYFGSRDCGPASRTEKASYRRKELRSLMPKVPSEISLQNQHSRNRGSGGGLSMEKRKLRPAYSKQSLSPPGAVGVLGLSSHLNQAVWFVASLT